jgi:hypothetical protein
MNNPGSMGSRKRAGHLRCDIQRFTERNAPRRQPRPQGYTVDILGNDV